MKLESLHIPAALKPGATIAAITLSWGGAGAFPNRYEQGVQALKHMGFTVIPTPHALNDPEFISNNPQARLDDLLWAVQNPAVDAIISIIGGEDSKKVLELITPEQLKVISQNPKIFVGLSDTTTINLLFLKAGVRSYYGPSLLFGIAENKGTLEYTKKQFLRALSGDPIGEITHSTQGWTADRIPWNKGNEHIRRTLQPPQQMHFFGTRAVTGRLIGGCAEALEELKETNWFPQAATWEGAILFLETAELNPSADVFARWLHDYERRGILKKIKGLIIGLPGGDIQYDAADYEQQVKEKVLTFEKYDGVAAKIQQQYSDLTVVTRFPIGHVSPTATLPIGAQITINPEKRTVTIDEAGTHANHTRRN